MEQDREFIDGNPEQRDEEAQAQTVADQSLYRQTGAFEDSEKAPGDRTAVMPDDTPDLIDRMEQMVSSGRVDSGAFAGEPRHDDEESEPGGTEPDEDDESDLDGTDEDDDDLEIEISPEWDDSDMARNRAS